MASLSNELVKESLSNELTKKLDKIDSYADIARDKGIERLKYHLEFELYDEIRSILHNVMTYSASTICLRTSALSNLLKLDMTRTIIGVFTDGKFKRDSSQPLNVADIDKEIEDLFQKIVLVNAIINGQKTLKSNQCDLNVLETIKWAGHLSSSGVNVILHLYAYIRFLMLDIVDLGECGFNAKLFRNRLVWIYNSSMPIPRLELEYRVDNAGESLDVY